ncbi:MAG TPA: oligosaccharide flippase family protein [Solirubrobacteraceae bacterium]|nr:oligosaccharide flippase family protein [Solirubrobacteraceae bacterium]
MTTLPIRYRRNVVSTYVTTTVIAVAALVTTPILAGELGKEAFGIWALVGSFALYLELLEFGFGKAAPKFVAEFSARGDERGLRATIATSFWILAALGSVAALIAAVIAALFPSLFGISPELAGPAQILILLVLLDLAISIPSDTFGGVLMGLQRFYLVNATLVGVTILQAIGWTIVLASGGGLVELGIVTVALSLAGQLARFVLARRHVPGTSIAPRLVDRSLVRRFTGLSVWFFVLDMSRVVVIRLDTVVVGLVVGVPAAGVYAVGQRLALALESLIEPLTKAFFPHSSSLEAGEDREGLRRSLLAGTRLSLAIAAPIALALGFLARPLIDLWLGGGFGDAAIVVVLLAAAAAVSALTRTGLLMLQGLGRARVPALMMAAEALLNLVLSVVLAHELGLKGVALGTLIALVVANIGFFYPYMCRQFAVSLGELSAELARAHAPALAVGVLVGAAITALGPSGVVAVPAALLVAGTYAAVFWFTGLTADERHHLRGLARRRRTGGG